MQIPVKVAQFSKPINSIATTQRYVTVNDDVKRRAVELV
jgi:hypothetical protein